MKKSWMLCAISLTLISSLSYAKQCRLSDGLSEKQIKVLKQADRIHRVFINRILLGREVYSVNLVHNESSDQFIAFLGETHIKGPRSSVVGKKVVKQFPVRMLEGVPKQETDYIAQNISDLDDTIGWKRNLLKYLTFNPFGSTIVTAEKRGYTFLPGYDAVLYNKKILYRKPTTKTEDVVAAIDESMLKSNMPLNLPLEAGAFLTPSNGDAYILQARNRRMASNILYYVEHKVVKKTPLVVVGAAHTPGLIEILRSSGYESCDF